VRKEVRASPVIRFTLPFRTSSAVFGLANTTNVFVNRSLACGALADCGLI